MSAAVTQFNQHQSMAQNDREMQLQQQKQQQLNFTTTRYRLRCTSHQLFLNDQHIPYEDQILNLDKFYVIKTLPNSLLKTPIILHRNKQIDSLDRRVFTKRFVFQIVKSLEICSFSDAAFICQRIPKQVKYFVTVIQGITQFRWKMLIMNDTFYLAFYSSLQSLITKKSLMSPLRRDILDELLKCNIQSCHARLFYMLDNLVLENEDLRNAVINLTRNIVMEEMEKKKFFQVHILGENSSQTNDESSGDEASEDGENSGIEDNLSMSDRSQNAQETTEKKIESWKITSTCWPQNLLSNVINATRTCLKLKLTREFICSKIINQRLLFILKHFFKEFFETQRSTLLKVLTVVLEIQPMLMWTIVFQQGKNCKNKNLKFLELLLTGQMRKIGNLQNDGPYSFLQKLIVLPYSPQRRQFLHSILNTFLSTKFINEQLECILLFLSESLREILGEQVPIKSICDIWKSIVRKIQKLIYVLKQSNKSQKSNNTKSSTTNVSKSKHKAKQQKQSTTLPRLPSTSFTLHRIQIPLSKSAAITLMKIYKVFIQNQKLFQLQLDISCIDDILLLTKHRKGVVESVRLSLIEIIEKGESLGEEMSAQDE